MRTFSSTPRSWDDIDSDSKPRPAPTRVSAAVSSLGSLSKSSSSSSPDSSFRRIDASQFAARPPSNLSSSNVISIKSLPRRGDGAPRPAFGRRSEDGSGEGRRRPGGAGFVPRFSGGGVETGPRPGEPGFVPRFAQRTSPGVARSDGSFPGGGGGFSRGRGGRGGPQRGRGRGRGGGSARGRARRDKEKSDKEKEREKKENSLENDLNSMDAEVKRHVRLQEEGAEVAYTPSTTLASLIGHGPAVATNTTLGAVDIAMRNMRLLGGGRPFAPTELAFQMEQFEVPFHAGKPIFYSSIKQKATAMRGIRDKIWPESSTEARADRWLREKEKMVRKTYAHDANDLKAELKLFEDNKKELRRHELISIEEEDLRKAESWKTPKDVTKKAIMDFAVQGKHDPPEYASDVYGKLSMYHIKSSTYKAGDAQKFDAKIKSLVPANVKTAVVPTA